MGEGVYGYYVSDVRQKGKIACEYLFGHHSLGSSGVGHDGEGENGREQQGQRQKEGLRRFAFIHVKGVDDAGHDANPMKKVEMLESVDGMVGGILENVHRWIRGGGGIDDDDDDYDEKVVKEVEKEQEDEHEEEHERRVCWILVTGDHSTPVYLADHSSHPVPALITRLPPPRDSSLSTCPVPNSQK